MTDDETVGAHDALQSHHHHRGPAGAHTAAHADWEASQYVPGLIDRPNGA